MNDPFCLDHIREKLERGDTLTGEEQWWVLGEAETLFRANRSLDSTIADHDRVTKAKDQEIIGLHMELGDLLDQTRQQQATIEAMRFTLNAQREAAERALQPACQP